ncbi:MAG: helix-turn-helix domain-containing protein [Alphaproteobacteria bacterium]|nr:helix-turn-helix domain-containing protein [Alphaproteobacteria bacterium]
MQVEVNSYQDIGEYLRDVRESLGFDIRDVGQQLNIRAKYLVALEEGKLDVMPGKVYARGYLQHYAEYLGLNKDEIAEAFDRMGSGYVGKTRYYTPEPTSRSYQPGVLLVVLALGAVLAVYYYWYKHYNATTPRDYEMVSPVPQRLLDPIIKETEVQENDDLFIDPMLPVNSTMQGDGNADEANGDIVPDDALLPQTTPMEVPGGNMPATQENDAPQTQSTTAPASQSTGPARYQPAPQSSNQAPSATAKKPLPWLQNNTGVIR